MINFIFKNNHKTKNQSLLDHQPKHEKASNYHRYSLTPAPRNR